jgi:hypothetical protein
MTKKAIKIESDYRVNLMIFAADLQIKFIIRKSASNLRICGNFYF